MILNIKYWTTLLFPNLIILCYYTGGGYIVFTDSWIQYAISVCHYLVYQWPHTRLGLSLLLILFACLQFHTLSDYLTSDILLRCPHHISLSFVQSMTSFSIFIFSFILRFRLCALILYSFFSLYHFSRL